MVGGIEGTIATRQCAENGNTVFGTPRLRLELNQSHWLRPECLSLDCPLTSLQHGAWSLPRPLTLLKMP